jgi:hypothetical protein
MSTGLYRLLRRRFDWIGQSFGGFSKMETGHRLQSALIALVVIMVLLVGAGGWLIMSVDDSESADGDLARVTGDLPAVSAAASQGGASENKATAGPVAVGQTAPAIATRTEASATPEPSAATEIKQTASIEPSAINGLRISSQSWRRGGLGSKALVTFTLRNDNAYPVKDVALACAFSRRDGSHLTDRTRIVPGPVGMKSRKTFAAVHVGFVNVNASKAKCTLVAANKI